MKNLLFTLIKYCDIVSSMSLSFEGSATQEPHHTNELEIKMPVDLPASLHQPLTGAQKVNPAIIVGYTGDREMQQIRIHAQAAGIDIFYPYKGQGPNPDKPCSVTLDDAYGATGLLDQYGKPVDIGNLKRGRTAIITVECGVKGLGPEEGIIMVDHHANGNDTRPEANYPAEHFRRAASLAQLFDLGLFNEAPTQEDLLIMAMDHNCSAAMSGRLVHLGISAEVAQNFRITELASECGEPEELVENLVEFFERCIIARTNADNPKIIIGGITIDGSVVDATDIDLEGNYSTSDLAMQVAAARQGKPVLVAHPSQEHGLVKYFITNAPEVVVGSLSAQLAFRKDVPSQASKERSYVWFKLPKEATTVDLTDSLTVQLFAGQDTSRPELRNTKIKHPSVIL